MARTSVLSLTEEDRKILQDVINQAKRQRVNATAQARPTDLDDSHDAPEVYVARPHDDVMIPALIPNAIGGTVDEPGAALCDIYRVVDMEGSPGLVAAVLTKVVYNLSSDEVGGWIQVVRDKFGSWFAITAKASGGGGTGTGTGTGATEECIEVLVDVVCNNDGTISKTFDKAKRCVR